MQIKIGNFVLAAGGRESPNGLNVQRSSTDQVAEGLRWKKKKIFDRQNISVTIRFSVTRLQPTIGAAERFVLTHGPSVPTSGVTQFILEDNSVMWMDTSSCVCTPVDSKHIGVTTTHDYTLIGGEPTDTKPKS